jgi:hypothetical protein
VHLSVWIPASATASCPSAPLLARLAPVFRTEGEGELLAYIANYPALPQHLESAVRLVGEVVNLPAVRLWINGRRVGSLTKFWSALLCYADSLREPDPRAYCLRKSARLSDVSGCPAETCVSHCQFICTRCLAVTRETEAPPVSVQLRAIALQAEVEWCPNLRFANGPSNR